MISQRFKVALSLFAGTVIVFEIVSCFSGTFFVLYALLSRTAICAFVAGFLLDIFGGKILNTRIDPAGKAVFITGCDSGFGYHLAKRLDRAGYKVFAGCLLPAEKGALELEDTCTEKLQVVHVDVTKDSSVRMAKDFVKNNLGNYELWAIVNNAGIFKGIDIEICPIDHFKQCLEVNTIGPVRVTKAFLPMLRQTKGRVVNVNSQAGHYAVPRMSPYCMSKHASVCFSNSLAQEMERWGVRVISVEPEFFQTSLLDEDKVPKLLEEINNEVDDEFSRSYGENYLEKAYKSVEKIFEASSPKINIVLDDLESAICLENSASVYSPCRNLIKAMILYVGRNFPRYLYFAYLKSSI